MLTVFFSPDVELVGITFDRLIAIAGDRRVLEEIRNQTILEDWHRLPSSDILCKPGDYPSTAGHLCMHFIIRQNEADIEKAEEMQSSKVCNSSSAV